MLERELLQFLVQRVQPQPVGDGRIDVQRFASDALAVRGRHRIERAHIVQTVGKLDQDDAYVLRHRQ